MTTHDPLLPAVVLQRKAVVYVRQSTPQQVQLNLESQRRQYELVEVARRRERDRAGVVLSGLCVCKQAPSFVRVVTALPSCASCVTMLPSAETRRDSQAMSSSRSMRSAAREICGAPTFRPAQ